MWPSTPRRRRLLVGILLGAGVSVQMVAPQPWVDRVLDPVARLFSPLNEAAAWLEAGLWLPPSAAPAAAAAPAQPSLDAIERRIGRPLPVPGLRWLEAPVVELQLERQQLTVLAPAGLALAPGMPVAFGDRYLGRLESVEDGRGVVRLWQGADMRTGLSWETASGARVRGVALGRGTGGPPILKWQEEARGMRPGARLRWRPHPGEDPALEQAQLRLGQLQQTGDAARDDLLWIIEADFPSGAEGRVFFATGAVGEATVASFSRHEAVASPALAIDAVFGPSWLSFRAAESYPFGVLLGADGVDGRVRRSAGGLYWMRRERAAAWGEGRLLVLDDGVYTVAEAEALTPARRAQGWWCSRGDARIPRGLRLSTTSLREPCRGPYLLSGRSQREVGP